MPDRHAARLKHVSSMNDAQLIAQLQQLVRRHEAQPASFSTSPPPDTVVSAGAMETTPAPRPAVVVPTAPERYKIQFTASEALHDELREAQALLRHQIPSGDIAEIFERALDRLLLAAKMKRFGATDRPQKEKSPPHTPRNRHIPNAIKRAVVERDGAKCTYMDAHGNRCGESSWIEFHHIDAFARGGAHTVDNITLRCAPHNRFAAEQELGKQAVAAKILEARRTRNAGKTPPEKSNATPPEGKATPPGKSKTTLSGKSKTTPPGKSKTTAPNQRRLLAPGTLRESHLPPHILYAVTRRAAALPSSKRCGAARRQARGGTG